MFLAIVLVCTGTKLRVSSKMANLVKTPLIEILRCAILVESVLLS